MLRATSQINGACDGAVQIKIASILRSIYIEQPSNVRGDIKLFGTEFASSGNTIVFNHKLRRKEVVYRSSIQYISINYIYK